MLFQLLYLALGTFNLILEDCFEGDLTVSLYLNSVDKKLLFLPLNESRI